MPNSENIEFNLVDDNELDSNLDFYTFLKSFIKIRLTVNQLKRFRNFLSDLRKNYNNKDNSVLILLRELIIDNEIITKSENGLMEFENFLNLMEHFKRKRNIDDKKILELIEFVADLFVIKDLITSEAKTLSVFENEKLDIDGNVDYLSLEYDADNLKSPYSQRVAGILMVFKLLSTEQLILLNSKTQKIINNIREKAKKVIDLYQINIDQIYSLIINESINQSITSMGGQSYEDRILQKLKISFEVQDILIGTHDPFDKSVEYDFNFNLDQYKIGISAKRTTRERYKQNFQDVDKLEVDCLLLVTLGVDLNESKMQKVLDKKGNFIVVADEVYQNSKFMKKHDRVLSSKEFNKENILKLIEKYT